MIIDK